MLEWLSKLINDRHDEIIKYLLISQVGLAVVAISLGVIFSWASTYDEPQPQKNAAREAGPASPAAAVDSPARSVQSTPQAQSGKQNNPNPSSSPLSNPNPNPSPSQTPVQASGSTAAKTPLASSPRSVNAGEAAQKTPAQPVARDATPAATPSVGLKLNESTVSGATPQQPQALKLTPQKVPVPSISNEEISNFIRKLRNYGLSVRSGRTQRILKLNDKGNLRYKSTSGYESIVLSDICPLSSVTSFLEKGTDDLVVDLGAIHIPLTLLHDDHNKNNFSVESKSASLLARYLDEARKKPQKDIQSIVASAKKK